MPEDRSTSDAPVGEAADRQLAQIMACLREQTNAARATLRLDVPGDHPMPMTHEALAPGVASVHGRVVQASGSPTVTKLMRDRSVVVVNDCLQAARSDPDFDDDGFRSMLDDYGDLRAYVAAPLFDGPRLMGIISLHYLGSPRRWSAADLSLVREAVSRVQSLGRRFEAETATRR